MRQPRAEKVAFLINKYLRLVFQTPKCGAVDNPVAVSLKFSSRLTRRLCILPPFAFAGPTGIGSQPAFFFH
jgi:hypothetical protein